MVVGHGFDDDLGVGVTVVGEGVVPPRGKNEGSDSWTVGLKLQPPPSLTSIKCIALNFDKYYAAHYRSDSVRSPHNCFLIYSDNL